MKKSFLIVLAASSLLLILFSVFNLKLDKKGVDRQGNLFACNTNDYTGLYDPTETVANFRGEDVMVPALAVDTVGDSAVLGVSHEERWIEVDLSEQKLYAWEGNQLFLETPVSTGLVINRVWK